MIRFTDKLAPANITFTNGKKHFTFPEDWTNKEANEMQDFKGNSEVVKTGKGLIVVDIDTDNFENLASNYKEFFAKELEDKNTTIVKTTHGYHFYYEDEATYKNNVRVSDFIDIRADGGCVVIKTTANGLSYEYISTAPVKELPDAVRELLTKKSSNIIAYNYKDNGLKYRVNSREKANFALFKAVESGDIKRIIPATGMSVDDFTTAGMIYISFNKFAFILANEPSIKNENVEAILELLVEDIMGFEWNSDTTQKMYNQVMRTMIWAPEYFEPDEPVGNIYMLKDATHIIITEDKIIDNIKSQALKPFAKKYGCDTDNRICVTDVKYSVDYTADKKIEVSERDDELFITENPSKIWKIKDSFNDEIIDDFKHFIWEDKLDDFIKIIALTLKLGENKRNKLLLCAPTSKGKSEIAVNLFSFTQILGDEFKKFVTSEKKLSKQEYDSMCRSGLVLIDEANDYIPDNFVKSITTSMELPVMYVGNQKIPVNFMLFASTSQEITEGLNDEFVSRLMVLKLENKDNTILTSSVYKKYGEEYKKETREYCRKCLVEVLNGDEGKKELEELWNKYRLDTSDNSRTILEDKYKESITNLIRNGAIQKDGEYYIKGKKFIKEMVDYEFNNEERAVHNVGQMKHNLLNFFEAKMRKRTDFTQNGKKYRNYYKIDLSFDDDFDEIDDEF